MTFRSEYEWHCCFKYLLLKELCYFWFFLKIDGKYLEIFNSFY